MYVYIWIKLTDKVIYKSEKNYILIDNGGDIY
jgi:hypothetical protein